MNSISLSRLSYEEERLAKKVQLSFKAKCIISQCESENVESYLVQKSKKIKSDLETFSLHSEFKTEKSLCNLLNEKYFNDQVNRKHNKKMDFYGQEFIWEPLNTMQFIPVDQVPKELLP
eukprot:snap_masked-scaffold_42-processed-gene-1.15-mRNA-1 protein AED:1.00 eAED:1.00 QI:0/-1/0/0/-1/1/1/0/118